MKVIDVLQFENIYLMGSSKKSMIAFSYISFFYSINISACGCIISGGHGIFYCRSSISEEVITFADNDSFDFKPCLWRKHQLC